MSRNKFSDGKIYYTYLVIFMIRPDCIRFIFEFIWRRHELTEVDVASYVMLLIQFYMFNHY